MNPTSFARSGAVTSGERCICTHRTTAATRATTAADVASCDRGTSPVAKTATTTATTTTAPTPHGRYWRRGSGLATVCPTSAMIPRRLRVYWTRPMNMSRAAAAKPQWNPRQPQSVPVSSGPNSAPMFTPT